MPRNSRLARLNAVERTLDEAECLLQSIMKRAGRSARVILHPILLAMPLDQAIDEKRLIRWSVRVAIERLRAWRACSRLPLARALATACNAEN